MTGIIKEDSRMTPVHKSCDVLVVGGGVAGMASALAAARNGAGLFWLKSSAASEGLGPQGLLRSICRFATAAAIR